MLGSEINWILRFKREITNLTSSKFNFAEILQILIAMNHCCFYQTKILVIIHVILIFAEILQYFKQLFHLAGF